MTEQERDDLLSALTDKQADLVIARAAGKSIKEAAKEAGFEYSYARLLLTKPNILDALAALTKPERDGKIASAEERQAFWTAVMRGDIADRGIGDDGGPTEVPAKLSDRLKGSELLGRAQTDFVERKEHTLTIIQQIQAMTDDELEERIRRLEAE